MGNGAELAIPWLRDSVMQSRGHDLQHGREKYDGKD